MPRSYVRKTDNASYGREKLLEAVKAVKSGRLSGYEASKHYGIPRSTIINRVYDRKGLKSNTLGRATVLSREAEEDLVKNLRVMEKHGFGLTRKELLETVGQYASVNLVRNPFKNGVPGEDWFLSLKKRHNLPIKKPQPVEYARKQACSPNIIYPYFNLLEETVNELGLSDKPSHIWNVDETSFSKDPSKSKVVGCKGFTSTRTISSPGKDNTTVLLGRNALGEKAPPMIVFKGQNVWDQWTTVEDYPGTAYAATSNGWMETEVFEAYFEKIFLKTVGEKRPILLLYDGHATHVGINLIKKAREANITILKIPPHTSHLLQPLDLAVNKSFKDRWDSAMLRWQRMNIGKVLPKREFSKMIGQIWNALDPAICAAGFRKGGIYPLNKLAVPENQFNQDLLREWKQKSLSTVHGEIPTMQPLIDVQFFANQISENTKSQEPRAGTSTQTEPVFEEKSAKRNTFDPNSLLKLSLKIITRTFHMPQLSQTQNTLELNEQFVQTVPEQSPKCQILENRIVTFEDLLLMRVKAGTSSKVKRKRMATGAEVITSDEVYKRTQEAEKEKQEKKNKTNSQAKRAKTKNVLIEEDIEYDRPQQKKPQEAEKEKQEKRNKTNKQAKRARNKNVLIEEDIEDDGPQKVTQDSEKENQGKKDKTNQQAKRDKNINRLIEKSIEDNEQHGKRGKENKKTLKKCRKRHIYSPASSETSDSDTEIKYDEESDGNDYWEDLLKASNEDIEDDIQREKITQEAEKENQGKQHKINKQEKRAKNKNEAIEEDIEDNEQNEKRGKINKNTLKKCRKRQIFPPASSETSQSDDSDANATLYSENDWLLVKFCTKKSIKHYVGVILTLNEGGAPVVKYARKKSKAEGETIFTFPMVDDISEVRHTADIVTKLPEPGIGRRGQIIFKMVFNSYNIQ